MRLVTFYAWMALACLTLSLLSQTPPAANANARLLTLDECIRLALEHNLDIRIARHLPLIAQHTVRGSYGLYYEPTLNVGAQHRSAEFDETQDETSFESYRERSVNSPFAGQYVTNTVEGTVTSTERRDNWERTRANAYLTPLDGLGTFNTLNTESMITGRTPLGTIWSVGGTISDEDLQGEYRRQRYETDTWRQTSMDNLGLVPFTERYGTSLASQQEGLWTDHDTRTYWAGLEVVQPLLRDFWTDPDRTQIQVNKKALKMSEFDLMLEVMIVITNVQSYYYDLVAAREWVKATEKTVELKEALLKKVEGLVKVQQAVALDLKQIQSQLARSRADLVEARRLQTVAENKLKAEITDDYGKWYNAVPVPAEQLIAIPESCDLNESWLRGLALRPEYNRLKAELEMQGLVVRLQRNQVYPRLDFVGAVGKSWIEGSEQDVLSVSSISEDNRTTRLPLEQSSTTTASRRSEATMPEYSVGLALSVPLGGNVSARAQLRAARQLQQQVKDRLQRQHLRVLVEIENAVRTVKARYDVTGARREERIYAEEALAAESSKLDRGMTTLYTVLEYQDRLTLARWEEITALAEYNKALVQLAWTEGSTLERHRVTVTYK